MAAPIHASDVLTARARRDYGPLRQLAGVMGVRGVSQTDLARELRLTRSILNRVLTDRARSRPTLEAVAAWAGIDVDALEADIRDTAERRKG